MAQQNKMFAWQESKGGLIFIVLFNLLIAFVFFSLASRTGSWIDWFIATVFLALAIGQGVRLYKKVVSRG